MQEFSGFNGMQYMSLCRASAVQLIGFKYHREGGRFAHHLHWFFNQYNDALA